MVALNVVGRFRHHNDLRAYRRALADEVGQDLALRLLPALIDLPLTFVDPDGTPRALSTTLREAPLVTLSGASGSGRRLALQQFALRWASSESATPPVPLLLALPQIDDGRSPPAAMLAAWVQATGQATTQRQARGVLPRLRAGHTPSTADDQFAGWLLLVHGWEELSPERRADWRAALLDAERLWPTMRITVAIPDDEPAWPGFAALAITPPTPALLASWVQHLVAAEGQATVLEALAPGGQLQFLGERLFEVALLAWLAPQPNLPATRADLYARALANMLNVPVGRLALAPPVVELQLLAAYGERPSSDIPGLLEPGGDGGSRFVHPQVRRYLAARQLVDEGHYAPLQSLDQAERDELALLIATMLADPTPLYEVLWSNGHPSALDVLALGRCLRERPAPGPAWALRVIGALALLARDGPQAPLAHELLRAAMPALDASLAAAAADERARSFLLRLFELLPQDLAAPHAERLVYAGQTPEPLAWDLADRLVDSPALADRAPPAPPEDRDALARWAYVQALRGPRSRQLLDPTVAAAALPALARSSAGDTRRLRVAVALLDDLELTAANRAAALALIEANEHPSALAVIERAGRDGSVAIRRNALAILARRAPARAYTMLSQAALDQDAPWDMRLDAIVYLGNHLALGADALLERCANDPALPLYARLRAVAALGRQPAGTPRLAVIAGDARGHPEVRAMAARLLGATRDRGAVAQLLGQLNDPTTPSALAQAACDGLGMPGDRAAVLVLLRVLDRATADVALTLASIQALGRTGDQEVIEPLSALLGAQALGRLQGAVDQRLLNQPVETCLDAPGLPGPIGLRLAETLAISATPADRPTTLAEFLMSEADRVRATTARALATIGGPAARAALMAALLDGMTGGATNDVVAALAEGEGEASAEALGYLLGAEEIDPLTRWLVVQQLAYHPTGEEIMQRALARAEIDPFTRGALAEALGQRNVLAALPLLRQLADDPEADAHLRSQAVLALGLMDQPAIEATLIHLAGNQAENVLLRGLAAEHLPARLSEEGRRFLRDLLRRERPPAPIAAGALRALGRARDREALPLMLRYCQDEQTAIAQAAIAGLADIGDANIAPVLVSITQNPNADRAVRLEAIGALLHIGGKSYRSLLQAYIERGPLPLQLQALEHLIATSDSPADLLAMLADPAWPQPLRLRLIEHLGDDPLAAPVLLSILEDDADDPHLRGLAAEALGRTGDAPTVLALIRQAERTDTPLGIRLRCVSALGQIGEIESWLALSRMAEDRGQPPTIRDAAALALRHARLNDG